MGRAAGWLVVETITPHSPLLPSAAGEFGSGDQATTGRAVDQGVGDGVHGA